MTPDYHSHDPATAAILAAADLIPDEPHEPSMEDRVQWAWEARHPWAGTNPWGAAA